MRRIGALACLVVCLVAPVASRADTPGYTPIGPPASLNQIVFARDGTVYGTVNRHSVGEFPVGNQAVWRSTDHGSTWNAVYRAPGKAYLIAEGASPAAVYVQDGRSVDRIDSGTGRLTPLALGTFAGADAADTAFGSVYGNSGLMLTRCPQAASACDAVPMASGSLLQLAVDPNSRGMLAAILQTPATTELVMTSSDAGATWLPGMNLPYGCSCALTFAGPAARTLYLQNSSDLAVSHDAGVSFDSHHALPNVLGVVVGSQPAALITIGNGTFTGGLVRTNDEGASFELAGMPGYHVTVDPSDTAHLFMAHAEGWEIQTRDLGHTWSDVVDPRFGIASGEAQLANGSGSELYAPGAADTIWHSGDMGASWARSASPNGPHETGFVISRDDPRIAYVPEGPGGGMRTSDGGSHWEPLADSRRILLIQPGQPTHLLSGSPGDLSVSVDAGTTWTPAPASALCSLAASPDGKLTCQGAGGPLLPPSAGAPFASGLFGSPDLPGAYAVATGKLIGDVASDWSLNSSLALTGSFGPAPELAAAIAAWPARGGSTFYAFDGTNSQTWVRRGTGRWWRLAEEGHALGLIAPLDGTHALVRLLRTPDVSGSLEVGVLDLAQPAVDPPAVQPHAGGLACVVPWSTTDAETSGYLWFRDGTVVRGAEGAEHALTAYDAGHDLTCEVAAHNDWGSTVVASSPYRVPGTRIDHLRLAGDWSVGGLLHCGATQRIDWLRDGRAVTGRHARSYRVSPADEGHALSCRSQVAGALFLASLPLHVPKPRGSQALPVGLTP